ncbi:MAG: aminoacyl-tRNA hydrolase [Chloroflexota bacterium]|jgi:PTH1 family peptidyl-tRNA hydrolase
MKDSTTPAFESRTISSFIPQNEEIQPFLVVGLGNPGREYQENRHNTGFMLAMVLAEQLKLNFSRVEMKAIVAKGKYEGRQIILAKPQTFMNLSGQSVAPLARYYKIPLANTLVIYDDVDLPFGVIRLRPGGGAGGHNGIKSIIQSMGTQDFPRLRIGIDRPPGRMEAADYVLQDFSSFEKKALSQILGRGAEAALTIISNGIDAAMNIYNGNTKDED